MWKIKLCYERRAALQPGAVGSGNDSQGCPT